MKDEKGFYWERHAGAERFCLDVLDDIKKRNSVLGRFEERLMRNTSMRLFCLIDHFVIRESALSGAGSCLPYEQKCSDSTSL